MLCPLKLKAIEMTACLVSFLADMVSCMKVFPTKKQGWVTLARKPMIADNPSLEKIFKSYTEVCLLNLPSPQKKAASRQAKPKGSPLT